jgi:molybdenum ABC transporter ATP-binding protein/molybdate ABC transporter permease protein
VNALDPLWLSVKVATISTLLLFIPGIGLGWLMARRDFIGKSVVEGFIHLPLVLPPVVIGYLLLLTLGRNSAVGGALNALFGIELAFSFYAAVLASAVVSLPLLVRSVRLAIELVDRQLEQASSSLGHSAVQTMVRVTLPLALPGIIAGGLLAFARSLGEFGATMTFAGNISGRTQTLPLAIYSQLQVPGGEQLATWLVVFSIVLSLLSLYASNRLSRWAKRRLQSEPQQSEIRSSSSRALQQRVALRRSALGATAGDARLQVALCMQYPHATQQREAGFALQASFASDCQHSIGLYGPSGAGKTTLLEGLAGLRSPAYGRIVFDGEVLFDSQSRISLPPQKRRIATVFQDHRLFPQLSVAQNLRFSAAGKRASATELETIVSLLELQALLTRRPAQLSGGQKRRVALGRALLAQPRLLLLDEPLTGLDWRLRDAITGYLRTLDLPMICVSHDMEMLRRLGDELILLDHGEVLAQGRYHTLLREPAVIDLLGREGLTNHVELETFEEQGKPRGRLLGREARPLPDYQPLTLPSNVQPGARLRFSLCAKDVLVSRTALPTRSSMENQVPGTLVEAVVGKQIALFVIDIGTRLHALVDPASAAAIATRPGQPLWCLFRASDMRPL